MLGSETCVTNCCGTDVTCNETSRTQNHRFLYFNAFLYVVIAIVVITIGSQNLVDSHVSFGASEASRKGVGVVCSVFAAYSSQTLILSLSRAALGSVSVLDASNTEL